MRYHLALLIVIMISGCIGKKCTDVTENYTSTETVVDKIPINITVPVGSLEPYVVRKHREIPLDYSIESFGSSVVKRPVGNESYMTLEFGRVGQNVAAYFFVVLKNRDNIEGNFTFVGRLFVGNRTFSRSETVFIDQGRTRKIEFEFNITRGQKWGYSIDVSPPKKIVTTSEITESYTREPKTFVEYKYVKRTIDVVKNRTVNVC